MQFALYNLKATLIFCLQHSYAPCVKGFILSFLALPQLTVASPDPRNDVLPYFLRHRAARFFPIPLDSMLHHEV